MGNHCYFYEFDAYLALHEVLRLFPFAGQIDLNGQVRQACSA